MVKRTTKRKVGVRRTRIKAPVKRRNKLPRVLKVSKQTGTRKSLHRDRKLPALRSGKRISKTGRIYWETRRNRSDLPTRSMT